MPARSLRRPFVFVVLLLLSAGCAPDPAPPAPAERPPNVIFILADDLGYGDVGAYGQERIRTPNLDALAREGMRFTQFYAGATVCAPSRSVLMTGRHTGHTSVRGNAGGRPKQALLDTDYTVAELFQDAGYATALIGKWGLGDPKLGHMPTDEGFDYFYGYADQVHAHNYYPRFLFENRDTVLLRNKVVDTPSSDSLRFVGGYAVERVDYSHDLFMNRALSWIEGHRDEPFFLYLALTIPHANNEERHTDAYHGMEVPDYGIYADRDWPEPQKGHAAMITRMDAGIGELVERLRTLGIDGRTIVFFSSDNGPHREGGADPEFFDSNGPLRGIKRDLYEGGIRVPTIAWGPGRVAVGTSDYIGYFGDFMATAAELAGVAPPDRIDSINLVPVLRGEAGTPHEFLYWEFYEQGSAQAARQGRWKAVRKPMHTGPVELYDLVADVGETRDLAAAEPEVAARMAALMDEAHEPDPRWTIRE